MVIHLSKCGDKISVFVFVCFNYVMCAGAWMYDMSKCANICLHSCFMCIFNTTSVNKTKPLRYRETKIHNYSGHFVLNIQLYHWQVYCCDSTLTWNWKYEMLLNNHQIYTYLGLLHVVQYISVRDSYGLIHTYAFTFNFKTTINWCMWKQCLEDWWSHCQCSLYWLCW